LFLFFPLTRYKKRYNLFTLLIWTQSSQSRNNQKYIKKHCNSH